MPPMTICVPPVQWGTALCGALPERNIGPSRRHQQRCEQFSSSSFFFGTSPRKFEHFDGLLFYVSEVSNSLSLSRSLSLSPLNAPFTHLQISFKSLLNYLVCIENRFMDSFKLNNLCTFSPQSGRNCCLIAFGASTVSEPRQQISDRLCVCCW